MDPAAIYAKTPKGLEEMQSRTYRLGLRARALLILVDGKCTAAEVIEKGRTGGNSAAFAGLEELEAQGFISAAAAPRTSAVAAAGGLSAALVDARRHAIEQLLSLLGPGADDFTARLEAAKNADTLLSELERCRNAVNGLAGNQKAARFWAGVQERLAVGAPAPAAAAPGAPVREGAKSLAAVRRFAIERMAGLPGPHGPAFIERLQSAADRTTLVAMLERCRNAVQITAGQAEAERFWAGVEERLP